MSNKELSIEEVKELPLSFEGRGEVGGSLFVQVDKSDKGYIYKATAKIGGGNVRYEVFQRKINQYGGVSYPKSKSFGKWAKSFYSLEKALEYFKLLQ